MADKSNTTNATELLNKICSGGTITPQERPFQVLCKR